LKVTTLGVIQAIKNVGLFLATYTIAGIKADPTQFAFALLIYACVSIPTDLYMLNKAHEDAKLEGSET